jgi:hypothetical protein
LEPIKIIFILSHKEIPSSVSVKKLRLKKLSNERKWRKKRETLNVLIKSYKGDAMQSEKGSDTIQRICNHLIEETLKPAQDKASIIIEEAERKASEIVNQAEQERLRLMQKAKDDIARERKMAETALHQAATQTLEAVKQAILDDVFNPALSKIAHDALSPPEVVAKLVEAMIQGIKKEGLALDLELFISQNLSKEALCQALAAQVMNELNKQSIQLGSFNAGVELRVKGQGLVVVLTDDTLKEVVSSYIRKEMREQLFKN